MRWHIEWLLPCQRLGNGSTLRFSSHRIASNPTSNLRNCRSSSPMASKRKLSLINRDIPLSSSSSPSFSNSSASHALEEDEEEDTVPSHFQELIISGNQLKDGKRVNDYVTTGNSTIDVVCRESRIRIRVMRITIDGTETTGLQVKLSDTVELVKSMIDAQEGIRSDEYQLIFNGGQLENNITVGDYGLKNDSVLNMMFHPSDTVRLRINLPGGKMERITVKPLQTIFDLKVLLQRNVNMRMPIKKWHLAHFGETLDDNETVAYSRLEDGSLLKVMLADVKIFVKLCSGKQIKVYFKQDDYVFSLKEKIFDKTGYPAENQMLIFSGRVLEEGQRITAYGIQGSSTVELKLKYQAPAQNYVNSSSNNSSYEESTYPVFP